MQLQKGYNDINRIVNLLQQQLWYNRYNSCCIDEPLYNMCRQPMSYLYKSYHPRSSHRLLLLSAYIMFSHLSLQILYINIHMGLAIHDGGNFHCKWNNCLEMGR